MTTAYPLAWPDGWPRTPQGLRQDSKYRFGRTIGGRRSFWTFAQARDALSEELERMKAGGLVLSTNFELRLDGQPRGNGPVPPDQGIAVYFTLKGRPMVMACDMHARAEENMRSLTLALEAMRQLERHGGGVMLERAFQGFAALPAPGAPRGRSWREVLEFSPSFPGGVATADAEAQIRSRYRSKAADLGAEHPGLLELNVARDSAIKEIRG